MYIDSRWSTFYNECENRRIELRKLNKAMEMDLTTELNLLAEAHFKGETQHYKIGDFLYLKNGCSSIIKLESFTYETTRCPIDGNHFFIKYNGLAYKKIKGVLYRTKKTELVYLMGDVRKITNPIESLV